VVLRNVRRATARRLGRIRLGLTEPGPTAVPGPDPDPDLGAALDAAMLALPEKYRTAWCSATCRGVDPAAGGRAARLPRGDAVGAPEPGR